MIDYKRSPTHTEHRVRPAWVDMGEQALIAVGTFAFFFGIIIGLIELATWWGF